MGFTEDCEYTYDGTVDAETIQFGDGTPMSLVDAEVMIELLYKCQFGYEVYELSCDEYGCYEYYLYYDGTTSEDWSYWGDWIYYIQMK